MKKFNVYYLLFVFTLRIVFWELIHNRLQILCQTLSFLAKDQSGFRENRNTDLAALAVVDKILPTLEEKKLLYVFFSINLLALTHSLVQYFMIN